MHGSGDVTHAACSTFRPLRKRCAISEQKTRTKDNAKLMCIAVWRDCRDYSIMLQCYKRNFLFYFIIGNVWDWGGEHAE